MERQTAVEFLITQISKDTLGKSFIATWKQEFEQAKEMEKEQNQRLIDWTLNAYGIIDNLNK